MSGKKPEDTPDDGIACPYCGSNRLVRDYQRSELVCSSCGLVVRKDIPNLDPEWREYDQEKNISRVGPPTSEMIHDKGLSTRIPRPTRDSRGKSLPPKRRSQYYRIRKWDNRSRLSGSDRHYNRVISLVSTASSQLNVPMPTRERAVFLYKRARKRGLIVGKSSEDMAAACVYFACRERGVNRSMEEITEMFQSSVEELKDALKVLQEELKLRFPARDPVHYVGRFANELALEPLVKAQALQLAKRVKEEKIINGRMPQSAAAAVLWMIIQDSTIGVKEEDVEETTSVSRATIEKVIGEIHEKLGGIVPGR